MSVLFGHAAASLVGRLRQSAKGSGLMALGSCRRWLQGGGGGSSCAVEAMQFVPAASTLLLAPQQVRFNLRETIGVRCIVGQRPYQEDRFCYETLSHPEGHRLYYFAVFDGHAGESSADYLSHNLHRHLSDALNEMSASDSSSSSTTCSIPTESSEDENKSPPLGFIQRALSAAFLNADRELFQLSLDNDLRSGSTASVLVIDLTNQLLVTAQLGDSRVVLCDQGRGIALTQEHTPHLPQERARIEEAGGSVVIGPDRIPRVGGLLTVTRAFGDFGLRNYGLIATPTLESVGLDPERHSFAILGSDGLFGVITCQEACDVVKAARSAEHAAELLVDAAEMRGTSDNITVIVVPLFAWKKYRGTNFSKVMESSGLDSVFGSRINELPKSLFDMLSAGPVTRVDIVSHIWSLFDKNLDEFLTPEEISLGLMKLGVRISIEDLELISSLFAASNGNITRQEFIAELMNMPTTSGGL
ncbi:MAG: hypothetical protein Q8P67_17905 [archaeon]|nr:hypothetical protein [archaeon]